MSKLPVIEGFAFTVHAMERAMERKVHAKDVAETLRNGRGVRAKAGNRPNTTKLVGPKATVVVNHVQRVVLTTYAS